MNTQNNLKATEKILGVWNPVENVQLWVSREPLMSIVDEIPKDMLDYSKVLNNG